MSNRFKDKICTEQDVANIERQLTRAQVLEQQRNRHLATQRTCTHKMGGSDLIGLKSGLGNFEQYAVSKFRLPSGDYRIRCNRCRKTWLPPLVAEFTTNGEFSLYAFTRAQEVYDAAMAMWNDLAMPGAPQVRVVSKDGRTSKRPSYRAWCPNE